MTYGYPPPPPPAKPPIAGGDLAASIILLIFTLIGGGVAAFFAVFMMAFTDYCPPATCHVEAGVTAVMTAFIIAGVIGLAGTVLTIVQLVRRKLAWPVAVGTMILCGGACMVGIAAYIAAVGG